MGLPIHKQGAEPVVSNICMYITVRIKKYNLEFLLKSQFGINVFISLKSIHKL